MDFNCGDYIKLKGSPNHYMITKIRGKRVIRLEFVRSDLTPLLEHDGKPLFAESGSGWNFDMFELIQAAGPVPKYYKVILKIREMDKRFQKRKLA